eukprot:TRINITY_DN7113_c0_g1_i2.p1 TRINITY_DN7113_c0_g1~~TRINITY_DN7113_c0_g1_i2.p1  ORF type:complete len:747 (-),score=191.64 TRINITY_DN7113_c0_g1_i2:56-2296(-)
MDGSSSLAKAQAYGRGWLARRKFRRMQRHIKTRTHIAREILTTEQSYLKGLDILVEVYQAPLREAPDKYKITHTDIQAIFSSVEILRNLHRELLKTIEGRLDKWHPNQRLGDVFCEMVPYFKMYTGYCANFDHSMQVLAKCREHKTFTTFLDECQGSRAPLKLEAYLIMPIQRIPRYNLLLEDLIRHTWEGHPDYEKLCQALSLTKNMAGHINQHMHSSASMNKVMSIQSMLGGECELVAPHRKWVKDGEVLKIRYINRNKERGRVFTSSSLWFFLFNDILVIAGRLLMSYRYIDTYPLDFVTLMDVAGNEEYPNMLQVECGDKGLLLVGIATPEEKKAWSEAIAAAIEDRVARRLSMSVSSPDLLTPDRPRSGSTDITEQRPRADSGQGASPQPHRGPPNYHPPPPPTKQQQGTSTPTKWPTPTAVLASASPSSPSTPNTTPTNSAPASIKSPRVAQVAETAANTPKSRKGFNTMARGPNALKSLGMALTMNHTDEGAEEDEDEDEEIMSVSQKRLLFERGLLAKPIGPASVKPAPRSVNRISVVQAYPHMKQDMQLWGMAGAPKKASVALPHPPVGAAPTSKQDTGTAPRPKGAAATEREAGDARWVRSNVAAVPTANTTPTVNATTPTVKPEGVRVSVLPVGPSPFAPMRASNGPGAVPVSTNTPDNVRWKRSQHTNPTNRASEVPPNSAILKHEAPRQGVVRQMSRAYQQDDLRQPLLAPEDSTAPATDQGTDKKGGCCIIL